MSETTDGAGTGDEPATPTFISITPDLVGFAELTADETERRILEWENDKRPDPTEGATDD